MPLWTAGPTCSAPCLQRQLLAPGHPPSPPPTPPSCPHPTDADEEWQEGQPVTGVCYKGLHGEDHLAHAHLTVGVTCRGSVGWGGVGASTAAGPAAPPALADGPHQQRPVPAPLLAPTSPHPIRRSRRLCATACTARSGAAWRCPTCTTPRSSSDCCSRWAAVAVAVAVGRPLALRPRLGLQLPAEGCIPAAACRPCEPSHPSTPHTRRTARCRTPTTGT